MTTGTIERAQPRTTMTDSPIRVMIVDDHPIVSYGLERLIADVSDMVVLGHAEDYDTAMQLAKRDKPDVMVIDISLGRNGPNGLALMKELREAIPNLRMLALSVHDEELFAERALHSGASGYLMKAVAATHIIEALRAVAAGKTYRSPWMREREIGKPAPNAALPGATASPKHSILKKLSDRELEVFELIGRGRGTREIAEQLHVSVKTIETHRMRIKTKLGIASTPDLVRTAVHWVSSVENDI